MVIDEELKIQFLPRIFVNYIEMKKNLLALCIKLSKAQLQNLLIGEKLVEIIRLHSGCKQNEIFYLTTPLISLTCL